MKASIKTNASEAYKFSKQTWSKPNAKFPLNNVLHLFIKLYISSFTLRPKLQIFIWYNPATLFAVAFNKETVSTKHVCYVTIRVFAAQPRTDVCFAYFTDVFEIPSVASLCETGSGVEF